MRAVLLGSLLFVVTPGCTQPVDGSAPAEGSTESEPLSLDFGVPCASKCDPPNVIIGCDDRTPRPSRIESTTTLPWAHVGRLSVGCSGALIGDRWVLTAAHCLPGDLAASGPVGFSLAQERECSLPFGTVYAKRAWVPQDYVATDRSAEGKAYDLALLELYEPIEGALTAATSYVPWWRLEDAPIFSAGYPGDKGDDPDGLQWHTGVGDVLTTPPEVRWSDGGARGLFYADLDGTGGQSGSPVYAVEGTTRTVVGVLIGAPERECRSARTWVTRLTTGVLGHIASVREGRPDAWWESQELPFPAGGHRPPASCPPVGTGGVMGG